MSRLRLHSILLLLSLLLPACVRRETVDEAPELKVELEVIPSPPSPGPTFLMIQISDERGGEIDEFTLDVKGDMSHAGMTPVIFEGANSDAGTYTVPFEWTMAGDWFITITATLPDGRTLVRAFPVRVEP